MTLANLWLKICIVEVTIIQNKRISCRFFPSQEILVFVYLKQLNLFTKSVILAYIKLNYISNYF